MLARPASPHHRAAPPADAALARALALAPERGPEGAADAVADAVAEHARAARAAGRSPRHLSSSVRRALAVAAPASMTALTFDALARSLVRHALRAYFRAAD
jgi:hypothetical protein